MPVAGTSKYEVQTGSKPTVIISVHFSQEDEKFYVPISPEHYAKLSDAERKRLEVATNYMRNPYVVKAERFKDAVKMYQKVLDIVHDTVENIESTPMICVEFKAKVRELRELEYNRDGNGGRKLILDTEKRGYDYGSDLFEVKINFHRVWHIKTKKRQGIIGVPLEQAKPESIRSALERGFKSDSQIITNEDSVYIPWNQETWDSLSMLHGKMHVLLDNLSKLLKRDADLTKRLHTAAKNSALMLGPAKPEKKKK